MAYYPDDYMASLGIETAFRRTPVADNEIRLIVYCVTFILLSLFTAFTVGCNAEAWKAMEKGYCQAAYINRQTDETVQRSILWVKCPGTWTAGGDQ